MMRWHAIHVVWLAPLSLLLSCRPSESPNADSARQPPIASALAYADPASLPPRDVVRRVHEHRLAGQTAMIGVFLLEDQKAQVFELLLAVDRFLAADKALRAAVSRSIGQASALGFDRSDVANMVGVFSRNITVVDERLEGERAIVTFQIADRVPLQEVQLVRREGRWMIQTDPPIPGVATHVGEMADVLNEAAKSLADKRMSAAELRAEIDSRQAAVARRLRMLARKD